MSVPVAAASAASSPVVASVVMGKDSRQVERRSVASFAMTPATDTGSTETRSNEDLSTREGVRSAVRAFLDEHFDRDIPLRAWLERLADSGWATPQWPTQWFGKGLPADLAATAFEEFRKAKAPGPPAGL